MTQGYSVLKVLRLKSPPLDYGSIADLVNFIVLKTAYIYKPSNLVLWLITVSPCLVQAIETNKSLGHSVRPYCYRTVFVSICSVESRQTAALQCIMSLYGGNSGIINGATVNLPCRLSCIARAIFLMLLIRITTVTCIAPVLTLQTSIYS